MKVKFGTRGSKLALLQTRTVIDEIKKNHSIQAEEVIIKTLGDKVTDVPLFKVGGQGLFIKEIENALLNEKIDIAVHSLKDVPHKIADGLTMLAYCLPEDPRDAFLSINYNSLSDLPTGAKVGTSSLRRRAQLSILRPDLAFTDFRGNLDTRLAKLEEGAVDAIILASAGLNRSGLQEKIKAHFPIGIMTPPAGQGIVALECREKDKEKLLPIVTQIICKNSQIRAKAERAFLAKLQGGCQTPMAVFAAVKNETIMLETFIGEPDGANSMRKTFYGNSNEPEQLGNIAAEELIKLGAKIFIPGACQ
jgi:hydroxymethylbilane synthase